MRDGRMSAFEEAVRGGADKLEQALTISSLMSALLAIVEPAGYSGVASGLLGVDSPDALHFAHWSEAWLAHYAGNRFIFVDPVPLWAIRSGAAISGGELQAMLPRDHPSSEIFKAAERFGYLGGYIVPQRSSDNTFGVVCFVGGSNPQSSYERLLLRGIASIAFERAEILRTGRRPSIEPPAVAVLSPRERHCLKLLVRGGSARQVARQMRISEPTVRFHIANLHRKLGVKRRSELISVAIARAIVKIGDGEGDK